MDQVEEVEGADLQEALHLDHLEDLLVPRGVLQDHRLALGGLGAVEVLVVRGKHRKSPLGHLILTTITVHHLPQDPLTVAGDIMAVELQYHTDQEDARQPD